MAGAQRWHSLISEKLLNNGLDTSQRQMLHLLNSQVRSTLLSGDVIWGPHMHSKAAAPWLGEPFKHPCQAPFNTLMRSALSVGPKNGTWMCLMLSGHLPVVDYMLLDFARFWNKLVVVATENPLIQSCLSVQSHLLHAQQSCWLSMWDDVLGSIVPDKVEEVAVSFSTHVVLDLAALEDDLLSRHIVFLNECGNPTADECRNRCTAVHYRHMHLSDGLGCRPDHISWKLQRPVRLSWMNFMVANSPIPARSCRFDRVPFRQRVCSKCDMHSLGDEAHVMLHCPVTQHIRDEYAAKLALNHSDIRSFLHANQKQEAVAEFVHKVLQVYSSEAQVA
jgi:hypothetical protein